MARRPASHYPGGLAQASMSTMTGVSEPAEQRSHPSTGWLSERVMLIALGCIALAGVILVLSNTRWGAYLSDDSYFYVYPARDAAAGQGFNPSYIFAPLLPLVLTGFSLLGVEALVAVRWLNAVLFGVNLLLVGLLVWLICRRPAFAVLGAALVLLADVVVEAHGWAMSEALSFTFMLLSMNAAVLYIARERPAYLWASAVCAALTVLTRYAALPLIAAVGLTLLFYAPARSLTKRLGMTALFGVVSIAPIAAYWLRNQLASGHPVRYEQFLFVPLERGQIVWFFYNWFSLFVPGRVLRDREILAGVLILLISAAVVAGLAWAYRRGLAQTSSPASRAGVFLSAAFLAFNLLMLYLARGLTQLDVFNPRYLVPMLIVFLALVAALAGRVWPLADRIVRLAIAAFLAVFLLYYGYRTFDFSRQMANTGLGYANVGWHNSETMEYLRQNPQITDMISTGEMGVYFWTGRMPKSLSTYPDNTLLTQYLCENNASLLLMDQLPAEIYGITREEAVKGLQLVQRFNDGELYQCPKSSQ